MPDGAQLLAAGRIIRLVLLSCTSFDLDTLHAAFSGRAEFLIAFSSDNPPEAVERLPGLDPDVVLLEPRVGCEGISVVAKKLRDNGGGHLVVLDPTQRDIHLLKSLQSPSTSYFTRGMRFEELCTRIIQIVEDGIRRFDPVVEERVEQTATGYQLRADPPHSAIGSLSERELAVWKLTSEGLTAKECGERLGIAASTVENHKTRLMRKLGLRKVQQLTLKAIRDGLIA